MINYDDHHKNIRKTITVTEFRRWMAHYIAMVRYGDDWVRIKRRGMAPVYLVSQADIDLIWDRSDELESGPRDPKTGRRSGQGLIYYVREAFRRDRGFDEWGARIKK